MAEAPAEAASEAASEEVTLEEVTLEDTIITTITAAGITDTITVVEAVSAVSLVC